MCKKNGASCATEYIVFACAESAILLHRQKGWIFKGGRTVDIGRKLLTNFLACATSDNIEYAGSVVLRL